MSERYNVFYDFCDECGNEEHDIKFVFEGTWSDLQDHIELLKKAGCYNIDAVAEPDEEYDDEDKCNKDGFLQYWDAIVEHMNDNIREEVHNEFAPCSKAKFLIEYCKRDKRFPDFLWREFEIAF